MGVQDAATVCCNGHAMTPENTYVRPDRGHRECRLCRAEHSRRWYWRQQRHGTIDMYFNHACRCDLCRAAGAEYMRDRRRRAAGYRPGRSANV